MNKKMLIGGGAIIAAYAVYAIFFLKRIPIGDLCEDSGKCNGHCIKMTRGGGEKLVEVCTKTCTVAADCAAPTTCRGLKVMNVSAKGEISSGAEKYCLRSE